MTMNALALLLLLLLCFSTVESFAPPSQAIIKVVVTSSCQSSFNRCYQADYYCRSSSSLHQQTRSNNIDLPRRDFFQSSLLLLGTTQIITNRPQIAIAVEDTPSTKIPASSVSTIETTTKPFHSAAYTLKEYTNSIVASRDTNISPKEVYDTISSTYLQEAYDAAIQSNPKADTSPRALDVGSGAGVSTEVLYRLGYHEIDALDWSGEAWTKYVVDDPRGYCPEGIKFYELDDERYLDQWKANGNNSKNELLFDVIVFNFAVNESKAQQFAKELLNKQHGRLLAPINTSNDYWLKQTYQVLDPEGKVLWSAVDVGAWSVQFQPDVTQDTCSGIWCAPFNGFQKKR